MASLARPSGTFCLGVLRPAADLLHEARQRERSGRLEEAAERYESALLAADRSGERSLLAEGMRRLAVVRHQLNDSARARDLCRESYRVAREFGNDLLAAEALNTAGGLELTTGSLDDAAFLLNRALSIGGPRRAPRGRIEQNPGTPAHTPGGPGPARARYRH